MRPWILAAVCALSIGCAQAAVSAHAALTAACNEAMTKCVDCYENERCTVAQSTTCLDCTRRVCDTVGEQLEKAGAE